MTGGPEHNFIYTWLNVLQFLDNSKLIDRQYACSRQALESKKIPDELPHIFLDTWHIHQIKNYLGSEEWWNSIQHAHNFNIRFAREIDARPYFKIKKEVTHEKLNERSRKAIDNSFHSSIVKWVGTSAHPELICPFCYKLIFSGEDHASIQQLQKISFRGEVFFFPLDLIITDKSTICIIS